MGIKDVTQTLNIMKLKNFFEQIYIYVKKKNQFLCNVLVDFKLILFYFYSDLKIIVFIVT